MFVRRRPETLIIALALVVAACNGTSAAPTTAPSTSAPATSVPAMSTNVPSSALPASPASSPLASAAEKLDGQIVFEDSGQDFKDTQIWLENADGSNVRQVVSDKLTDNSASLSPDGSKIVFYRQLTDSLEAAVADPSLFGALTIVNTDGSGLHDIATADRAKRCDLGPEGDAWSPDGSRIAYVRFCFDKQSHFVSGGVWTIEADGTDPQQVTNTLPDTHTEDHRVGWSPDGLSLVFERIDTSTTPERAALFTIGLDGSNLFQVTPWSVDGNDPDWSPDGSLIVFNASAEPSPTQNIWTIHPDGTGLTQLTKYDEANQATFHPTWSPDGTHILFSHSPSTDGWGDFFVMNRDGSGQHVLAMTLMHENHGQWGPDAAP
jgi:TolB protein